MFLFFVIRFCVSLEALDFLFTFDCFAWEGGIS